MTDRSLPVVDPPASQPVDPACRLGPDRRVDLPDAPSEYAVPVRVDGQRATPLGHADSPVPVYDDRFAPGRVASSTRLTLADGLVVTTEALVPGQPVDVVPHEVIE